MTPRWIDRALGRHTEPTANLQPGHLYLRTDAGELKDLGPCTVEDLRLTAHIAYRAYTVMKRTRTTQKALSRTRTFTARIHDKAKSEDST